MHKYAAPTALAIALNITMLALAVSASLTAANAQKWCVTGPCNDKCMVRCGDSTYARVLRCKPGAFCDIFVVPPDIRACKATCKAKEAAKH